MGSTLPSAGMWGGGGEVFAISDCLVMSCNAYAVERRELSNKLS